MRVEQTLQGFQLPTSEARSTNGFGDVFTSVEQRTSDNQGQRPNDGNQKTTDRSQKTENRRQQQRPEKRQTTVENADQAAVIAQPTQPIEPVNSVDEANLVNEAISEVAEEVAQIVGDIAPEILLEMDFVPEVEAEIEVDIETVATLPEVEISVIEAPVEEPIDPIVTTVAETLDVEPQEILEILTKENIEPKQLQEPAVQHKVIQQVHRAESPADLLEVENITEIFTEIEAAVEQVVKELSLQLDVSDEILVKDEPNIIQFSQISEEMTVQPQQQEEFEQSTEEFESEIPVAEQIKENTQQQIFQNMVVDQVQPTTVQATQQVASYFTANNMPSPPQIVDQIASQIKLTQSGGITEMKMTLSPESLGEVSLKIATHNGIVVAQFVAESQRVKEIIESNLNQLRDELENKGIEVSGLSVSVRQDNQDKMDAFLREQEKSRSRINSIIKNIMVEAEEEGEILPDGTTVNYRI